MDHGLARRVDDFEEPRECGDFGDWGDLYVADDFNMDREVGSINGRRVFDPATLSLDW